MSDVTQSKSAAPKTFPDTVREGCSRIAPAWPLDSAIAVNPWWQLRHLPFSEAAAQLETLGQAKCLMSREEYKRHWQSDIQASHLVAASRELGREPELAPGPEPGQAESIEQLVAWLDTPEDSLPHWHHLSELLDGLPERQRKMRWHDEIVQQISQFCGLFFQHTIHVPGQKPGSETYGTAMYRSWLRITRQDKGIEVLTGERGLHLQFDALPECPRELCQIAMETFGQTAHFSDYVHALLLDVNGWASWIAYQRWQDDFAGTQNDRVEQLLAIRLAWELALWRHTAAQTPDAYQMVRRRFIAQFEQLPHMQSLHRQHQARLWIWQRALELSYQSTLQQNLLAAPVSTQTHTPQLQAAFCIDVRSEPMRRALETLNPGIQTIGFAGFFGLPIEYQPTTCESTTGIYRRPQLPGLLAPQIVARQENGESGTAHSGNQGAHLDHSAFDTPAASFGLVEMFGALKSLSLLRNSFRPTAPKHPVNQLCDDRPFVLSRQGHSLSVEEQAELAYTVLMHMGLTQHFAPVVLLLGHGSATTNNPQAASLDCGACGGQTGEVNVKVLAQLLNNHDIRQALAQRDIHIPDSTRFVAGLHNTTTEDIVLYGASTHNDSWQQWLQQASELARKQRDCDPDQNITYLGFQKRSQDWSEIRPEWGLANNAAFIVAPRNLTRGIDLQGRTFLHDYDWRQDQDFKTLELIMTAPMIVTNWINLQYYASTVDNRLYGSGNKLLHNVVGEHIGVFEGNGGDLRIGLARQSLHDGTRWRHQPLRLSVYIAAPRDAILTIVKKHTAVAELIDNDWLTVFQWDADQQSVARLYKTNWTEQEICI